MDHNIFDALESQVRGYCRSWPVVFDRALGSHIWDVDGNDYVDFFSGAGALNYGHNHPAIKAALLDYLSTDRVIHSLDMHTVAKQQFLERFRDVVLAPNGLDHKVQFPGPTGTNSVEAALKIARKVTGRETIVSFTNAFHGMTLGSLSVTGNSMKRDGAGVPLVHTTPMPYDNFLDGSTPDFMWFERLLTDNGSGLADPAAVIVETVQGEGGVNVARGEWLRALAELCQRHGILLVVDDVQMGCGRTGTFFSFTEYGIEPDVICLSKSISGSGLPMALTLIKPEYDVWEPGEHNGTFRGNNPAFVTATAALDLWTDDRLPSSTSALSAAVQDGLLAIAKAHPDLDAGVRGRGAIWGLDVSDGELAGTISREAFARRLLVETSGPDGNVVKLMPALTIESADLLDGLDRLTAAVDAAIA
jgi:diaminobutyrate-2-oxoglutarate transaminase